MGTIDFDTEAGTSNLTSLGSSDIFIIKMDASGSFQWARNMGSVNADEAISIKTDALGYIYSTGYFTGVADFDPGTGAINLTSVGNWDAFIQKLSSDGNLIWAKRVGANGNDFGHSVSIDMSGNVYTTGGFTGTVDFNPDNEIFNLTSSGMRDIFIQKLDSNGDLNWAKKIGASLDDWGLSVALDTFGNMYAAGVFSGTVDFDPGVDTSILVSMGSIDIFIVKLDNNGNFIWAKSIGSSLGDIGLYLTVDSFNNIYLTGSFSGTADFDPGPSTHDLTSGGLKDAFILKLDSNGNFNWAEQVSSPSDVSGYSIALDNYGGVYATGIFTGIANLYPIHLKVLI